MGTSISYLQEGNLIRRARQNDPGISARARFFSDPAIQQALAIHASQLTEVVNNANFIQVNSEQGIRVGLKSTYIFIKPEHPLYELAKQALTGEQATQTPPLIPLASKSVIEFTDTDPSDLNRRIQELEQELADKRSKIEELQTLIKEWETAERDCWQNFSDTSTEPGDGHEILGDEIPPVAVAVTHAEIQTHPTSLLTSSNAVGTDPDPIPTTASTKTQTILQLTSAADVQTDPIPNTNSQNQIRMLEVCIERLQEQTREPTLDLEREGRRILLEVECLIRDNMEQTLNQKLSDMQIDRVRPYEAAHRRISAENTQLLQEKQRLSQQLENLQSRLSDAVMLMRSIKMTNLFKETEGQNRVGIDLEQTEEMKVLLLNHHATLAKRIKTLEELNLGINKDRANLRATSSKLTQELKDYSALYDELMREFELTRVQMAPTVQSTAAGTQTDLTPATPSSESDLSTNTSTVVAQPITPEPETEVPMPGLSFAEEVSQLQHVFKMRAERSDTLPITLARLYWFSLIEDLEMSGMIRTLTLADGEHHPVNSLTGNKIPFDTTKPRESKESFDTMDTSRSVTRALLQAVAKYKKIEESAAKTECELLYQHTTLHANGTRTVEGLQKPTALTLAFDDLRSKDDSFAILEDSFSQTHALRAFKSLSKSQPKRETVFNLGRIGSLKTAPLTKDLMNDNPETISLLRALNNLRILSAENTVTLLIGTTKEEVVHAITIMKKIMQFYLLTKKYVKNLENGGFNEEESRNIREANRIMKSIVEKLRASLRGFGNRQAAPALPIQDSSVRNVSPLLEPATEPQKPAPETSPAPIKEDVARKLFEDTARTSRTPARILPEAPDAAQIKTPPARTPAKTPKDRPPFTLSRKK